MIYDHIKNISQYKGISKSLDLGLDFIASVDNSLNCGVHYLDSQVKAIISEYKTHFVNEKGYEAHRKYIDIQIPINGIERVRYKPIEFLCETTEYNAENDFILFSCIGDSVADFIIGDGYFLVLFPDDGHMPQICVNQPEFIKKITIKVPVL